MFLELWMKIFGIKSYCRICARPIFNRDTSWGKRGVCVYCNDAYNEAKKEVLFAESKFAPYNSSHEGYAIIAEELDKLWDLVKGHSHDYKEEYKEAKQIACTAIRYMQMCAKHDRELQ